LYYFAYASNLNKKRMQEHCPDSQPKFTAVLPNYKLAFLGWDRKSRGALASIQSFRGEKVRGAVYEVTEACLRRLDKFETGYTRLNVIVFNPDDEAIPAVTYIMVGQLEAGKPSTEYLAVIQQGLRDWRLF
jgi:gamma-glutamylcyclotransferase